MIWLLWFSFLFFTPKESAIYSNDLNESIEKALIDDIQNAKSSITLLTYSISDFQIIKNLKAKKKEGLDVKVLIDCNASPHAARYLLPEINPIRRECKGLMHYKFLVIDHRFVWVGSTNMTGDSLRLHSNLMQRLDYPRLAQEIENRFVNIGEEGFMRRFPPFIEGSFELWFLPDSEGATKIKELMRSAQKSIQVAMYTFTRQDFADTLIRAHQRGVTVEVIIDRGMATGASQKIVNLLKSKGILVRVNKGQGLMHHKFMLVDDEIWVHGSANWTKAAFTQNDDYFIVQSALSPQILGEVKAIWKALMANSN